MTTGQLDRAVFSLLLFYALFSTISISAIDISITLCLILAIWRRTKEPFAEIFDRKILYGNLFFVFACFLSMLVATQPLLSFNWGWNFFNNMFPMFVAFIFLRNHRHVELILHALAISLSVSSLYAIFQGLSGIYRASGFLSDLPPQSFAGLLELLILLFLILLIFPHKHLQLYRPLIIVSLLLGFVALLFNGTRGVWLSIIILLFPLCFQLRRYRRQFIVFLMIVATISAVVLAVPAFQERLISVTKIRVGDAESQRLYKWEMATKVFQEHPILGVGADNYKLLDFEHYLPPEATERGKAHAHNIFFNVLAEMGTVGIFSLILMFTQIVTACFKNYRQRPDHSLVLAALYCTAGLLLYGMTEYIIGDFIVMRLYWFIIGLACVHLTLTRQPNQKEH